MTATATAPPAPKPVEPGAAPPVAERERVSRWIPAAAVVAVWIVVWFFTEGTDTLALPGVARTDLHDSLTEWQNDLLASRDTNPVMQFTNAIAEALRSAVDWLQRMVVRPNLPRPVPEIGWLGVIALATYVGLAVANWRIALLVLGSFLSFGVFGYWEDSLDLLIITGIAVALAVAHRDAAGGADRHQPAGQPGHHRCSSTSCRRCRRSSTCCRSCCSSASARARRSSATLIYALPPLIRIAGFGIREVSTTTIEATDSAGQTYWQRLFKVQLPMARKTIIVGLNQTTLAALSMATLAAFVNGPGLGKPVLAGLRINDVGTAFVPGALIVVMAVMLDRTTTAASERAEKVARGGGGNPRHAPHPPGRSAVWRPSSRSTSRAPTWAWPSSRRTPSATRSPTAVSDAVDWFTDTFGGVTGGIKDAITNGFLNPMQSLLAESPWYARLRGDLRAGLRLRRSPRPGEHRRSAWPASGTSTCGTTR